MKPSQLDPILIFTKIAPRSSLLAACCLAMRAALEAIGPLPRSEKLRAALSVNPDDSFFAPLGSAAADPSSAVALPFQQFLSLRHGHGNAGAGSGTMRLQDLGPMELDESAQVVIVPVGAVPGGREKLDVLCAWSSALLNLPVHIHEVGICCARSVHCALW